MKLYKFSREMFTMIFEIIIGALWAVVLMAMGVLLWLCLYGIIRIFVVV